MPIVKTVKGNLVTRAKEGAYKGIAHGCNIYHAMGSGIAPQIADAFEGVREADFGTPRGDESKLGTFSSVFDIATKMLVANCYTQAGVRQHQGDVVVSYKAIAENFRALNFHYLQIDRNRSSTDARLFGIPQIGAGLAGGHWDAIEYIINNETPDLYIELVMFDG